MDHREHRRGVGSIAVIAAVSERKRSAAAAREFLWTGGAFLQLTPRDLAPVNSRPPCERRRTAQGDEGKPFVKARSDPAAERLNAGRERD